MELNNDAPARPALRYYGGGWLRAPWTIGFIPKHEIYLEPCFGAGSILLRKPVAAVESVNDRDARTVNFFRVLREESVQLLDLIHLTPWAEDELRRCIPVADDPLEDARRFFMVCWATIQGGPTGQGSSASFRHQNSNKGRFVSPPLDGIGRDDLLVTAERLKRVQIFNRDALEMIEKYYREDAVIYFDPPYLASTRRRKKGYNHEPDVAWHKEAAKLLCCARGPVLVAGYRSELYAAIYEDFGFVRMEREQRTNGKTTAVECLWLSPVTLEWLERDRQELRSLKSLPIFNGI